MRLAGDFVCCLASYFFTLQIKLQYQDGAGTADGTVFHGGLDVNKDGLDCALIFDGTDWRLEMVSGVANNLRCAMSAILTLFCKNPRFNFQIEIQE